MRDVLVSASMTSGVVQVRRGTNSVVKGAFGNEFVGQSVQQAHVDTNLVFVALRTGLGVLYYAGSGRWVDLGKTEDFGDVNGMVITENDDVWAAGGDGVHRVQIPWVDGRLDIEARLSRSMDRPRVFRQLRSMMSRCSEDACSQ